MMTLLNVVQNEIRHAFDRLRVDTVARLNEKWMVGVKATDGHDGLRKVRSSHQDSPCLPGDSYRDVSWLGPNVGQITEVQLLQARKLVDCGLGRVCSRSKMRYEGFNCTLHASD